MPHSGPDAANAIIQTIRRTVATFGHPLVRFISWACVAPMMGANFKFIHCADLHLGSRFRGIAGADPAMGRRMTDSVKESFRRIVDLAISEDADAMFVSGDLYDDGNELPTTRAFLASELGRLDVPVFIARGNHDSRTRWDGSIPYPGNVHEFGSSPERLVLDAEGGSVEVLGVSFGTLHEERDLSAMLTGTPGMFTVACLHCDVDSASEGYRYAPCTLSGLLTRGVDYWALGHIHKRQVLHEHPHIVYPGNIQGRSVREAGEKGAYVVTVRNGRVDGMRFEPTQSIVWRDVSLDITGRDVNSLATDLSAEASEGDMVRITLNGRGRLDTMARTDPSQLASILSGSVGCTVTSVVPRCAPESATVISPDGRDMASKVAIAYRRLEESGRDGIIATILSSPQLRRNEAFFRSLSDEQLRDMVRDAASRIMIHIGGSS